MVIVENRGNKMITMVMNLVTDDNSYKLALNIYCRYRVKWS